MAVEEYTVEKHFVDEGVWVTVPTQVRARTLIISDPQAFPTQTRPTPNVFELKRPVINFEVREDDDQTLVHEFSPPMVLMVRITEEDIENVGKGNELKLAFWDGSRWVVFTKEKHQLELHSRFAIALIRHWGDPGVGVGR